MFSAGVEKLKLAPMIMACSLMGAMRGVSLATTTDLLTMTTTQDVEGLAGSEGSASRRRLGLEAVRPFPVPNHPSLLPSLEAGIRHRPASPPPRHQRRTQGLLPTWRKPSANRAWPSPSLGALPNQSGTLPLPTPCRGSAAAGGMDALLPPAVMEQLNGSSSNGNRFEAQPAYGSPPPMTNSP